MICKKDVNLQNAWQVFHMALVFVVVTFILDLYYDSAFIQSLGWVGIIVLFMVKVFFYSGAGPSLIEVISGQEMVFSWKGLVSNAKMFWKWYVFLSMFPFIVHFFLNHVVMVASVPLNILHAHLNIVVSYLFIRIIVHQKYVRPYKLKPQRKRYAVRPFLTLLMLCLAELVLFYAYLLFPLEKFDVSNAISFLREGLYYFQFIYLSVAVLSQYPELNDKWRDQKSKNLLLINPLYGGLLDSFGALVYKRNPAAFVVLKALTPSEYRVRIFNQYLWRKNYYRGNCLVAVTSFTNNSCRAYKIAKEFKRRGARVVLGGPHSGCMPSEALEFCDSVVVGEAESVWPAIIHDYEKGSMKSVYYGERIREFYPQVHQEILNSPLEEMQDYIETTRGCKYRCDFCSVPSLCGGNLKMKRIEEIIEILKKLKKKYRRFYFIDNNIYSNPAYARALFQALKPLRIRWAAGCTIDIVKHREDLLLAKESGCEGLLFGYEIMADSDEKRKGGKYTLADKYVEYSQIVKKMGIKIKGSFIIGWESDRWKDLLKLWLFAWRINPQISVINVLTPLPGSQQFTRLLRERRVLNLNWKRYAFDTLVFRHKHLNYRIVTSFFHFYRMFVLLTTSKMGYTVLLILITIFALYNWAGAWY
jgi:radical SAM superfamily enzyme YgiQ (UPF0313 family)